MIDKVNIFDEFGRMIHNREAPTLTLQKAVNMLIQEHNDLIVAVAIYVDRPMARETLKIDSGPRAMAEAQERLRALLECRLDPNLPFPTPGTGIMWNGDLVSGSGIDLRPDAERLLNEETPNG